MLLRVRLKKSQAPCRGLEQTVLCLKTPLRGLGRLKKAAGCKILADWQDSLRTPRFPEKQWLLPPWWCWRFLLACNLQPKYKCRQGLSPMFRGRNLIVHPKRCYCEPATPPVNPSTDLLTSPIAKPSTHPSTEPTANFSSTVSSPTTAPTLPTSPN